MAIRTAKALPMLIYVLEKLIAHKQMVCNGLYSR